MRDHARTRSQGDYLTLLTYSNNWDATKIYGCECDEGYQGYDCGLRTLPCSACTANVTHELHSAGSGVCPHGDDPMTTDQDDEVQYFKCLEDPASSGSFTLTFRGYTTEPITYSAEAEVIQTRLNALPSVQHALVRYEGTPTTACSNTDANPIQVTFLRDFGDLPHLLSLDPDTQVHPPANFVFAYDGEEMDGQTSVKGTKENKPCSGRGRCDTKTGICHCYTGYVTSDGRGEAGTRGDCGYANEAITACPGTIECSGHGVCSDHPYYECSCNEGWMGGDCSERTCLASNAWFDYPFDPVDPRDTNDRAHDVAECSNKGTCNRATGECVCQEGFEGATCERIRCPKVGNEDCNGHGKCLTMYQLALLAEINGDATDYTYGATPNDAATWDFDKMYGCYCDAGFQGYDCSERTCPTGDDVDTTGQNKEKQVFMCTTTDAGTFKLKFRQHTTSLLTKTTTGTELKAALEALDSIGTVTVAYTVGTELCLNGNVVSVVFETELGDVPSMTDEDTDADTTITFSVDGDSSLGVQSLQGDVENVECSNRGLCDHTTGLCKCFVGYDSSDSSGNAGGRGDCGHRMPWVPVIPGFSTANQDLTDNTPFDVFT